MQKVGAYTTRVTESDEWRPGNPGTGQQATPMLADYFNMLQRELVGVVEGSEIELDGEDNGQLLKAIQKQAAAVSPVATKAEAETNDEATANNVKRMTPLRVLQAIKARMVGATESAVGLLRVGTQEEINAGTLDSVAVTPKKLRLGFLTSFATNGYVVFPVWLGSVIIQWGRSADSAGAIVRGTFPIAFRSDCYVIVGSQAGTSLDARATAWSIASLTQYDYRSLQSGGSGIGAFYVAIGR